MRILDRLFGGLMFLGGIGHGWVPISFTRTSR
jgi:hypothetical protein